MYIKRRVYTCLGCCIVEGLLWVHVIKQLNTNNSSISNILGLGIVIFINLFLYFSTFWKKHLLYTYNKILNMHQKSANCALNKVFFFAFVLMLLTKFVPNSTFAHFLCIMLNLHKKMQICPK